VYSTLGDVGRGVVPVGRLDRDTSGLLIFTNDPALSRRLTEPGHRVAKTYHARVRGQPEAQALRALREGLDLGEGIFTRPARARLLGTPRPGTRRTAARAKESGGTWIELVLTEGKKRQVRRMCAAVGHEVLELVRVRIGRLGLGDLAPGEWRELAHDEVALLTAALSRQ
jgi:23S rRNA pseudouridine2457 synthase